MRKDDLMGHGLLAVGALPFERSDDLEGQIKNPLPFWGKGFESKLGFCNSTVSPSQPALAPQ